MAETLGRTSPLDAFAQRFADLPDSVRIVEEPFLTMIDLRADATAAAALTARLGIELPTAASTYAVAGTVTAIWMGPDEWLVTSTSDAPDIFELQLREAVSEFGGTAADVSAQRTTLWLSGSHAREVLAQGCSIDLHPRVFAANSAVQTMLGQANVVLSAGDDAGHSFQILVRSSFARYLACWLLDAATEFTP
jgi:sarcosine oxidase, subunit gamma